MRNTTVVILAALTLASMKLVVAQNAAAAPLKGGKAEAHMSDKGRANTNGQWSADPENGWVRAEERQQIRNDKKETSKRNQVNRKGNSSKRKL